MPIAVDWAISMLFYSAVHYVGAYFAKHGLTYRMHQTRDNAVARDPNLSNVYGEYRELEHFSRQARYERPSGHFRHGDIEYLLGCLDKVKGVILPLL